MRTIIKSTVYCILFFIISSCAEKPKEQVSKSASEILGNPNYLAISYGGYREKTRDVQPTIAQLKEDMKILAAMNVKILRTYNVQLKQAENLLEAISQLQQEDPTFEMYIMLGAWIDCENAWTDKEPNHDVESEANKGEIERAVALTNKYPNIVKIIAVGNEAMVKWAASYYVQPNVILKWVNYLQDLKKTAKLPADLWITSSDNFASWGGGSKDYHTEDLVKLINAVDYISLHTYPFHNTHYASDFWRVSKDEENLSEIEKVDAAMLRAKENAIIEYQGVVDYLAALGIEKQIHIGETGWASASDGFYGNEGSKATDEYKQALFYKYMRDWTKEKGMSCFYFEAFDEQWKDAVNPLGSENHFGLINLQGQVKYALWNLVDEGVFKGLSRDGKQITKTYNGDKTALIQDVFSPPAAIKSVNE
jgi:exo-beta-1,3-glucanase (GH17 family)